MNQPANVAHDESVTRQTEEGRRKWTVTGERKRKMTDNSFFSL